MKTVFPNAQVAHVWASQSQPTGRGSHLFFDGATIYSYGRHFPIASFVRPGVVFFTNATFSISTSKHINYTRRALHGLDVKVFYVEEVGSPFGDLGHARNVRGYREQYATSVDKASRARSYAAMHITDAENARAALAAYVETFELKDIEPLPPVSDDLLKAAKERQQKDTLAKARANAAREAQREIAYVKELAHWRAHDPAGLMWQFNGKPTALRLSRDGSTIQTTRGAEVPANVAPMLWQLVKHARVVGALDYSHKNNVRVGSFTLREVCADGSLVIGCHTLPYDELEKIAITLGLTEQVQA